MSTQVLNQPDLQESDSKDNVVHIVWIDEDPDKSLCGLDMTKENMVEYPATCKFCVAIHELEASYHRS